MTKPFLGPKKAMVMLLEASDFTLNYIRRKRNAEEKAEDKTVEGSDAEQPEVMRQWH
ncbi:MAG: hypothetical protein JW999_04490 [Methanotrichaceae archaeon]|nr:hypothetical protein [Methanotrichaceae archaeon]